MNQKKKILLVLYYQGPCSTDKISDMLGHCSSSVMTKMKRMGLILIDTHRAGWQQGVRSLNGAGCRLAEMIKKDISFWTYVKLMLGVRVR